MLLTYISDLEFLPVKAGISDGMIMSTIPKEVSGQSYAFITSDMSGT